MFTRFRKLRRMRTIRGGGAKPRGGRNRGKKNARGAGRKIRGRGSSFLRSATSVGIYWRCIPRPLLVAVSAQELTSQRGRRNERSYRVFFVRCIGVLFIVIDSALNT